MTTNVRNSLSDTKIMSLEDKNKIRSTSMNPNFNVDEAKKVHSDVGVTGLAEAHNTIELLSKL